jgi:hypothetical protein
MDLATIQIKVDTREVRAANDDIAAIGHTGKNVEGQVKQSTTGMKNSFSGLKTVIAGVGSVMAALGVAALGKSFASTITDIEGFKGALVTATGSIDAANSKFDELIKFASTTPFTIEESIGAFIRLKNLGLDPSEKAMTSYGNTAAALGTSLEQMIEAVADASTMEFERLKQFGIRAKQQADTVTFTFQEVSTTVGKNAEEITQYLRNIGDVNFAGAMENQMKRLPGLLSNLKGDVTSLFIALANKGGLSIFTASVTAASAAIVFLTDNLEILAAGAAAVGAALLVAFGPAFLSALATASAAMMAFMTTPAGIAAALAAAAVLIIRNWDDISYYARAAALEIEIKWNQLKLFLMQAFAPALTAISDLFTDVQDNAVATWTAIKAAAADPLDAISTFNSTFDDTIEALRAGRAENQVFAGAVAETESNILALRREMVDLKTTTYEQVDASQASNDVLEQFPAIADEVSIGASNVADGLQDIATEADKATTKTAELLAELLRERDELGLSDLQLEINNNLRRAGVDANSELGQAIAKTTTEVFNERQAYEDAADKAKELERAGVEAAQEKERRYKEMHQNISGFFVDLFNNGKSAFDNLLESWKNTLIQIVANWASSGVMNLIGDALNLGGATGGAGAGAGGAVSSAISSAAGGGLAGIASAGSQFIGGLTGSAVGASATIAGPPTAATAAGMSAAGAGGGIVSGIAGAGKAVIGGVSKLIGAIPGWGWALAGLGTIAALMDKSGTYSHNAGLMLSDIPGGLRKDRRFDVAPFASGLQPIGFNRRTTVEQATAVIDAFRAVDGLLTDIVESAGINVNYNSKMFSGYNEKGLGTGLFFGLAHEDGGKKGIPLEDQLNNFTKQWINNIPVDNPDAKMAAIRAGDSESMIRAVADMVGYQLPSHRDGLSSVPYDGYIAELHAGERVLTAQQTASADRMSSDMATLRQSMQEVMIAVARNTQRLYRINDRWDKDGLPPTRA